MTVYYDHYKDEGLYYCCIKAATKPFLLYCYKFLSGKLNNKVIHINNHPPIPKHFKTIKFEDLPPFIQEELYKDNLIAESDSEDDEYSRYKMT